MSEETNTDTTETPEATAPGEKTYSATEYADMQNRARQFEGKVADLEHKLGGINLDSIQEERAELARLREEAARNSGNPDDLEAWKEEYKTSVEAEFSGPYNELKGKYDEVLSVNKRLAVTDKAMGKIQSEFTEDVSQLLRTRVENDLMLHEGEIVVKDDRGEPMRSKQDPTNLMGLGEYVESLKESYPSGVKSTFKGGDRFESGVRTEVKPGASGHTFEDFCKMNNAQRAKHFSPRDRLRFGPRLEALQKGRT